MSTYETHITVDCERSAVTAARELAVELGLAWTHIELSSGERPSQPMLTVTDGETLEQHRARGARVVAICDERRIRVLRIKTEGSVDCAECLSDDARAQCARDGRYFESHVKINVDGDDARERARMVARAHEAHFSRSARRATAVEERFVTVRMRAVSRAQASATTRALVEALEREGLYVSSKRAEYVLYDSDFSVDRGWSVADAIAPHEEADAATGLRVEVARCIEHALDARGQRC